MRGALSLGAVLRESAGIVFRHVPALLVLAAVAHGPWVVFYLDRMHVWWAYLQSDDLEFGGFAAVMAGWMALIYGPLLSGFFFQTAIVRGVYLTRTGARFPFWKGLGRLRRLPIAILVAVLMALAVGAVVAGSTFGVHLLSEALGAAPLVLLGLMAYLIGLGIVSVWFVAVQVSVAEKGGPFRALGRSAFLTRGSRWRIFALLLVLVALGLGGLWGGGALLPTGAEQRPWSQEIWRHLLWAAFPILASTLHAVAAGVVYHHLRRAKEGIEVGEATQVFE